MEQPGDFAAVVAERSTTPCPKDNGVVGVLHTDGQYLENAQPHGRACFTAPLRGHFTGIYRRAGDDCNCVWFIEKTSIIGAKDGHIGRIDGKIWGLPANEYL